MLQAPEPPTATDRGGPSDPARHAAPSQAPSPALPTRTQLAGLALAALALFAVVFAATSLAQRWTPGWPLAAAIGLAGGVAMVAGLAVVGLRSARAGLPGVLAAADTPTAFKGNASSTSTAPGATAAPQPVAPAAERAAPDTHESESFAYTVSHDLRAPIRVIEGFTRIVREDYGHLLDRVGNDHLDRVLGAAARMNHMIDALLTLARLSSQPLARQPVDLSRLAQHVLDDLCKHTPQRRVDTRVTPQLRAEGDPTLLRLVLENLLGNAWKYSARRELAQIEFGVTQQHGPHHGPHVGGRAAYFISDNGAGFDMRFADRLFGPFQRLHSASEFQGTGVGLASVQRIIKRHGGEIWAEAEVDRGATFYFTLG